MSASHSVISQAKTILLPLVTTNHLHGDRSRGDGSSGLLVKEAESFYQQLLTFQVGSLRHSIIACNCFNLWPMSEKHWPSVLDSTSPHLVSTEAGGLISDSLHNAIP